MWGFLSWCSYASHHFTIQVPLVENLHSPSACFLSLCSCLWNHISCQIACCYKPATLSSFFSERGYWNFPARDALFYFPVAGNYNSCRCRLSQGQGHEGTRSKQQDQLCLFTSLQTLGETRGPSVLLSRLGGALHHINWSPISFGSHSCWRMTILSQSTQHYELIMFKWVCSKSS